MDKKIEEKPIQKPKKKETYNTVRDKMVRYKMEFERMERLIALGIPKYIVHFYETPSLGSGFMHGELVHVKCNNALIENVNNVCKPHGTNNTYSGEITFNFNLKSLREYVEICKAKNEANDFHSRVKYMTLKKDLEKRSIDWNHTTLDMKMFKNDDWTQEEDIDEETQGIENQ